jgi:hypothetical protein
MKIYGSAIIDDASSTLIVDYDGRKVSENEIKLLAYSNLTWKGLDLPPEECSWVVVTNDDGCRQFQTILEFQMFLRKKIMDIEFEQITESIQR